MNNFVFYSPTEFVFGKDTEGQTGTLAKKYNARKVMIVYGGGSIIRSGLLQRIEESLQQAGVEYVKLGGIHLILLTRKCTKHRTGPQRRRGLYASRGGRFRY